MTRTNRTFLVGRALLLALTLALGIVTGIQPAAACSDTAERYPMLIGSGYEGEPCEVATTSCTDASERFPMLIGSGYDERDVAGDDARWLGLRARRQRNGALGKRSRLTRMTDPHDRAAGHGSTDRGRDQIPPSIVRSADSRTRGVPR
jgi:hypothetical protein